MKTTTTRITVPIGQTRERQDVDIRTESGDLKAGLLEKLIAAYGDQLMLPATLTGEILASRKSLRKAAKKSQRKVDQLERTTQEYQYALYDAINLLAILAEESEKLCDVVDDGHESAGCPTGDLREAIGWAHDYLDCWQEEDDDAKADSKALWARPRPDEDILK